MSDVVLEKYRASSMENKIKMLEACVLWLNLQIAQAAENIDNQ